MANPNGRKGSSWEREVVLYLREHGFPLAERRVSEGSMDRGDVSGVPDWTLEAKNTVGLNIGQACKEAAKESKNAKTKHWAVIFKRRQHATAQAYVVLELEQFIELSGGVCSSGTLAQND